MTAYKYINELSNYSQFSRFSNLDQNGKNMGG